MSLPRQTFPTLQKIPPDATLPTPDTLRVLYADPSLVAISKPSGLLSVPGRGDDKQDCAHRRIRTYYPDALIVHRLDMGTSGVLLFALGTEALRRLSWLFESRQVHKQYVAIVRGERLSGHGQIDLPLITDWENRPRQIVDHTRGKPALTRYTVTAFDPKTRLSRLDLQPLTGRTHQLRVHLAATGTPIVGDPLYGTDEERLAGLTTAPPPDRQRLLLHATQLAIVHPFSGLPLIIDDPVPF